MTYREDVEGLDASILMHARVWEASGHVENFTDPMIDCKQCKARFRLDTLTELISEKNKEKAVKEFDSTILEKEGTLDDKVTAILEDQNAAPKFLELLSCPQCGNKGTFTQPRKFNLMFKTFLGPVDDSANIIYLRPETAQGIFVNFLNVLNSSRQKLPFGIAQIGKAFRNEINTKNFLFRTREFEQMEMQFFCKPGTDTEHYEGWKERRIAWFKSLGMTPEKLRFHDHPKDKLAHYGIRISVRLG